MPVISPMLTLGLILAVSAGLILMRPRRADLVAVCTVFALAISGLIPFRDTFVNLGRSPVITLIAVFILTRGLERAGLTRRVGAWLTRVGSRGLRSLSFATMATSASVALFMNNIAAVAMLLPAVSEAARRRGISSAKLMLPLAYSTLLGGMATLLTTGNLITSGALRDRGFAGYGLLDFLAIGLPLIVVGIAYMAVIGVRFLPAADPRETMLQRAGGGAVPLGDAYELNERVQVVSVPMGSPLANRSLGDSDIGAAFGLSVLAIVRDGRWMPTAGSVERIRPLDLLVLVGRSERVEQMQQRGHVLSAADAVDGLEAHLAALRLVELVLAPRSPAAGLTLRELRFRSKFHANVLAIWHGGRTVRTDISAVPLEYGDAILVQASEASLDLLRSDPAFVVLREAVNEPPPVPRRRVITAGVIFAGAMVLAASGTVPEADALMLGAVAMVASGGLAMEEAYRAVDWRTVFTVVGLLPVSAAIANSGAADALAQVMSRLLGPLGPVAVIAGLLALTGIASQVVSGQVSAALLAPIAISAAQTLALDPRVIAMAVAYGSSLAFLSPTAHPVNMYVLGPGGYQTSDYVKFGFPLMLLSGAVITIGLTIFLYIGH